MGSKYLWNHCHFFFKTLQFLRFPIGLLILEKFEDNANWKKSNTSHNLFEVINTYKCIYLKKYYSNMRLYLIVHSTLEMKIVLTETIVLASVVAKTSYLSVHGAYLSNSILTSWDCFCSFHSIMFVSKSLALMIKY